MPQNLTDYEQLTSAVCSDYRRRASKLESNSTDTGSFKELRMELQKLCGVTELEAVNILRGFNTEDYIAKYRKLRNAANDPYSEEGWTEYADWLEEMHEKSEKRRRKETDEFGIPDERD